MTTEPVSVCPLGAHLGEGPVWVERDQALWLVDIKGQQVHRFDPKTGSLDSWSSPEQIGWVLPADNGAMVAGLQSGLHHFDPASGHFALLAEVETDRPGNRLNDAVTDIRGRIWFGSMDDGETSASGEFYRFEGGRVSAAGLPPVRITNGPAVSPDGRTLYHVDTIGRTIHATEILDDGQLGKSRIFVEIAEGEGFPDGPTVDSEGCLWIALFFGWAARRYSPRGELLEAVRFPVSNITKLAFGGNDLKTVFATTARLHLKAEDLTIQPEAGNLFAFRADVAGVPVAPVAL